MKGFGTEPEIVWHYTQGEKLFHIGDSQLLKADMGYVPRGDQPVAWFTRSEIFDPCAYPEYVSTNGIRGMLTSLKEVAEKGKGLLRIGIAADTSKELFSAYRQSLIKDECDDSKSCSCC